MAGRKNQTAATITAATITAATITAATITAATITAATITAATITAAYQDASQANSLVTFTGEADQQEAAASERQLRSATTNSLVDDLRDPDADAASPQQEYFGLMIRRYLAKLPTVT